MAKKTIKIKGTIAKFGSKKKGHEVGTLTKKLTGSQFEKVTKWMTDEAPVEIVITELEPVQPTLPMGDEDPAE